MRKTLLALAALAAAGLSAPAAMATPVSAALAAPALNLDLVEQAQMRRDDPRYRHRGPAVRHQPRRHRYAPGTRLRQAPPGYRRYGARPGNWRTRGCVQVGPLWFCP